MRPARSLKPGGGPASSHRPRDPRPRLTASEYHALVRLAARINALTAKHGIAPAEAERLARAELAHNQPRTEDTR